jgi:hypothetical protein
MPTPTASTSLRSQDGSPVSYGSRPRRSLDQDLEAQLIRASKDLYAKTRYASPATGASNQSSHLATPQGPKPRPNITPPRGPVMAPQPPATLSPQRGTIIAVLLVGAAWCTGWALLCGVTQNPIAATWFAAAAVVLATGAAITWLLPRGSTSHPSPAPGPHPPQPPASSSPSMEQPEAGPSGT